jgi:hypothetical protein
MNKKRTYDELLSAYIDGMLDADEIRFVEETLLKDPEWKKRHDQMYFVRSKMLSLPSSGSSQSLWPTLSQRITEEGRHTQKIEIIPAKLVPVVTLLIMIIVGVGSYLITRNWDRVTAYFEDTRSVIGDIYEQGFVKGALQPLFQSVTDDDLIRFAFSGVLEIPQTDGKGFRVDSEPGDRFELEYTDAGQAPEAPSLSELYADLHVTTEQRRSIDSVLTEYKNIIRTSAFLSDGEDIIISPEIAGLNRFIIASIAEKLIPEQRVQLNNVLHRFSPEMHIPEAGSFAHIFTEVGIAGARFEIPSPLAPEFFLQIPGGLRPGEPGEGESKDTGKSRGRAFIIVKPDTVITGNFELPDISIIMESYADTERMRSEIGERVKKALQNTRINIQPHIDTDREGQQVRIITQVERSGKTDDIAARIVKTDSLMINRLHDDHFLRLHELSKILHQRSETIRRRIPARAGEDSAVIQRGSHPFDESFEKNMQQLEFDLQQLGERLDSLFDEPEKFLFKRDSIFFHLFPDTVKRKD